MKVLGDNDGGKERNIGLRIHHMWPKFVTLLWDVHCIVVAFGEDQSYHERTFFPEYWIAVDAVQN